MERDSDFRELALRYLLGESSEEEQEQLEARLLEDDEAFDHLLATEDELLEAYARDELPPAQRALIAERVAASAELKRRLQLLRTLVTVAEEAAAMKDEAPAAVRASSSSFGPVGSWYWMSFSVVALAAAIATAWLFSANLNLHRQAQELSVESDRLEESQRRLQALLEREQEGRRGLAEELEEQRRRATALARQVGRLQEALRQRQEPTTVSFVLTLGLRALSKPTGHPIPPDVDYVELQLDLEGDDSYESFRAVIRNSRDQEVWSKDGLSAADLGWGRAVRLLMPADVLPQDRFEIILLGVDRRGELEDAGYYELHVLRPGHASAPPLSPPG